MERTKSSSVRLRADAASSGGEMGVMNLAHGGIVKVNQSLQFFTMTGLTATILEDALAFQQKFLHRQG